jgi:hypothetical protein
LSARIGAFAGGGNHFEALQQKRGAGPQPPRGAAQPQITVVTARHGREATQAIVYAINILSRARQGFARRPSCRYCAMVRIRRKTAQTLGKMVVYPPFSPSVSTV